MSKCKSKLNQMPIMNSHLNKREKMHKCKVEGSYPSNKILNKKNKCKIVTQSNKTINEAMCSVLTPCNK